MTTTNEKIKVIKKFERDFTREEVQRTEIAMLKLLIKKYQGKAKEFVSKIAMETA